jgi:malate/lactate dehydrogenase
MGIGEMKVGIIGAGAVGSACLTALVARGCAREIVVVNRDRKRAEGLVTDVQYGAVLYPYAELRAGDYSDLEGAALVMITSGAGPIAQCERALLLKHQKAPGELDHSAADPGVARSGEPLFATARAALIRRAG